MDNTITTDTAWSKARWNLSLWFMRVALAIAPSGTAKDRLAIHAREWCHECMTAWERRRHLMRERAKWVALRRQEDGIDEEK